MNKLSTILVAITFTINVTITSAIAQDSNTATSDDISAFMEKLKKRHEDPSFKNAIERIGSKFESGKMIVKEDMLELYSEDPGQSYRKSAGDGDVLTVFISASVPVSTLRNYLASAEDLNGVMKEVRKYPSLKEMKAPSRVRFVLRGFIEFDSLPEEVKKKIPPALWKKYHGKSGVEGLLPTAFWVKSLLVKDPSCPVTSQCALYSSELDIDPELFGKFGIEVVPTVHYRMGAMDYFVPGDVSLAGALITMGKSWLEMF